jgi:hypothetical protein
MQSSSARRTWTLVTVTGVTVAAVVVAAGAAALGTGDHLLGVKSVGEAVLLIAVLAGLVALVVGMTRWRLRDQDRYRAMVQASDAAMREVAATLHMAFTPGRVDEHPMLGAIPAFGVATGALRGLTVCLRVSWDGAISAPVVFRTEVAVFAPKGSTFGDEPCSVGPAGKLVRDASSLTLTPRTACLGASMSYRFFLVTDARALRSMVEELCAVAERLVR